MANTAHPVTGPTIHCNETHVPDNGGAAAIRQTDHMAAYPSKDQGRFSGATPDQNDMPGAPLALRKEYPKHAGEAAEIHGPLKAKFNGAR